MVDLDLNSPILVPNPNFYRAISPAFLIQVRLDTSDSNAIKEQIRQGMRIERALAAFCNAEISLEEYFEIAEETLGLFAMDDYLREAEATIEEDFKLIL